MNDFTRALADFKSATLALAAEWESQPGDVIENYPEYLPSFDEFAHDVTVMYIPPEVEAGDMGTTDGLPVPPSFPPLHSRQIPGTPRHN